jgi:hypothetical protein
MTNNVLWRTAPDVNVETTDGFATETEQGACIRLTDDGGLSLSFWTRLESGSVDLSYDDAAGLHRMLTGQMGAVAAQYLAAAKTAEDARPSTKEVVARFHAAKDAYFEAGFSDETKPAYREARAAFWDALQVGDDEPLPASTLRMCCPGKSCGPTYLLLRHEGGDRWSYRREGNDDLYFAGTIEELRVKLRDPNYKP